MYCLLFFIAMMLDFERILKGRILVFITFIIITITPHVADDDEILKSMKQIFELKKREIDNLTSLNQGKASSIIYIIRLVVFVEYLEAYHSLERIKVYYIKNL